MAEDQIADWLIEALLDLGLQPRRGLSIDRVRDDDAVGRDEENGEMKVVLKPIEIAGDLGNRALRRVLRQYWMCEQGGRHEHHGDGEQLDYFSHR